MIIVIVAAAAVAAFVSLKFYSIFGASNDQA